MLFLLFTDAAGIWAGWTDAVVVLSDLTAMYGEARQRDFPGME